MKRKDVAALNGTPVDEATPDASADERTVKLSEVGDLFISAGMASDLEHQGWTVSPLTGQKIVKG